MLLLRRLARRRPLPLRLPLRPGSSPLSSSTATAPCSSWSPLPPPPPPAGGKHPHPQPRPPPSSSQQQSEYDESCARTIDLASPFVHPDTPTDTPPIKVVVVSSYADARHWSERLARALQAERDAGEPAGQPAVLGLDLEWKPTFTAGSPERRAAVLQLSGPGLCLVVQLHKMGGRNFPTALRQLLRDPGVLKVGVSINHDLLKLRRDWGLQSAGSHDVGLAAGRIFHGEDFRMYGIARLVSAIWGVPMVKAGGVRCSNWEAPRLSEAQVRYAALDAIAGREIYLELRRRGQLPGDGVLEGMVSQWLLSGDEGKWRSARSLAMERDSLRRLYEVGTGQSCFERQPRVVRESAPVAVAPVAAATVEREDEGLKGRRLVVSDDGLVSVVVSEEVVEEEEEEVVVVEEELGETPRGQGV